MAWKHLVSSKTYFTVKYSQLKWLFCHCDTRVNFLNFTKTSTQNSFKAPLTPLKLHQS